MRRMAFAVLASICLGAVMTFGDWLWAALQIRHRVVYGLLHGALMCLCLGIAVGIPVRKELLAGGAGLVIGVIAAASFYLLAPLLGWNAMFPAWMLLWILFALLQHRLAKKESIGIAVLRGAAAAMLSGVCFYAISGIWTEDSHSNPNLVWHWFGWTAAFLPGFLALFFSRPRA